MWCPLALIYLAEAQHELVLVMWAVGRCKIHNNCSGKHAGMLALSRQLGADPKDYVKIEHPVQKVDSEGDC